MSQIFISKNNSTSTPLAPGASFIGLADILSSWQEIDITVSGSPGVAPGTLYFEFSPDGINWDVSVPLILDGPSIPPITLRVVSLYFRVRYINGGTNLTVFRLNTTLHRSGAMRLTRFVNQTLDTNEPVEVVRIAKSELPIGAASESTLDSLNTKFIHPVSSSTSSVAGNASSVILLAANTNRRGATIFNESAADLYIKLGTTASLTDYTVKLISSAYYEVPYNYVGRIDGIWTIATGNARIAELT